MCPSCSAEALRGHINVPITYKELSHFVGTSGELSGGLAAIPCLFGTTKGRQPPKAVDSSTTKKVGWR